jgi:Uma2 family endonuclease
MATATIQIGPADNGRIMTLEEFLEAEEEEGYRYELARGVLEVTQVPNDPHGLIVSNLLEAIAAYKKAHPGHIWRFGGAGEFQLRLPGLISGRNPDAAVVLKGTSPDTRGRRPAALAIEVVSVGGEVRDYVTKREEYLAYGLREYWIVDPQAKKVTVLMREGDVWVERVCQGDQPVASLVLPGFATTAAELLSNEEGEETSSGPV